MLSNLIESAKKALENAVSSNTNSFKYCSLSTSDIDGNPSSRIVVLRDFNPSLFFLKIYTDSRSKKISHLKKNKNAELLLEGKIILNSLLKKKRKNDYRSIVKPGIKILDPYSIKINEKVDFFVELEFKSKMIEILQLGKTNHMRAQYIFKDNKIKGSFVSP